MVKKAPQPRVSNASGRGYDEVDDRITIPLGSAASSSSSSSATLRDGIDKYRSLSGRSSSASSLSADKSVHATWKSGLVAAVRSSSSSVSSSSSSAVKEPPAVRAETLMNQKQFAAALPVFTEALAADSSAQGKLKLLFQRGSCALAAQRFQQAVDDLTQVIQLTPSNSLLLAKRAKAYAGLKEHAAALNDYSAAIVMTAPTQEELRGLLMARAAVYANMNSVSLALEDLAHAQQSTRGGDRDPELFYQRAQLRQKCRQPTLALADLDKFMELQEEDWSEREEFDELEEEEEEEEEEEDEDEGRSSRKKEQDEEEDDRRRRLVDVRMERAALLRALASEEESKRLKDAELLATEQGEQQPLLGDGSPRDSYRTSVDTRGKRRPRTAASPSPSPSPTQSQLKRRKNRTTAMYEASYRSREALALLERAIEDYSQIVRQDPGHAEAFRQRAECWALVDRADNAFLDFDAALALDKHDFPVHMAKVKLLFAQREIHRAIEELTRVIEINGFFVDALFLRAEMHEAVEDWDKAKADYTAIIDGQLDGGRGGSESEAASKRAVRKTVNPAAMLMNKPISDYALQALLLRARVSQEMHDYDGASRDYERILESTPNNMEAQYELQENHEKKQAHQNKLHEDAMAWLEKEMGRGDSGPTTSVVGAPGGASASTKAKKKKKKPKKKNAGGGATTPTTGGDGEAAEKEDEEAEKEKEKEKDDAPRIEDVKAPDAVAPSVESSGWRKTPGMPAPDAEKSNTLSKKSSFSSVSIVVTRDEACESMWDEHPDEDSVSLPLTRLRLPGGSRGTSPLSASEFFALRIDEQDDDEEVAQDAQAKAADRIAQAPSTTTTTATDDEDDEPDVEEPTPLEVVTDVSAEDAAEKQQDDASASTPSHVTIRERLVDEKYLKKRQKQLEKLRSQLTEACDARDRDLIEETIARAERKQMLDSLEEEVVVAKRVVEDMEEEAKRLEEERRKQERYRQQEQERAKRLQKEEQREREAKAALTVSENGSTGLLPGPQSPSPTSSLVIRPIAYGHALHVAEQHQQQVLQYQRLLHEKDAEIAYLKSLVATPRPAQSPLVPSSEGGVDSSVAKATIAKLLRSELDTATIASRVEALLEWMSPSVEADEVRVRILRFVRHVLERHWPATNLGVMPLVFVATGSFPMKTYLPTADLDVMLFLPKEMEPSWHLTVLHALCMASDSSDDMGSAVAAAVVNGSPDAKGSAASLAAAAAAAGVSSSHTVRNVTFVNAEVRVVKSTIDNISVDLTANRVGALGALLLLDEMDRRVGQNHLLKKSLILIKSWCFYESSQFMASSGSGGVLGASSGALSTYAINTIVMALFNQHGASISHPLTALLLFLDKMAEFSWHENALTLFGDVPLALLATSGSLAAARHKLQQQKARTPHHQNAAHAVPLDSATLMAMEDVERIRLHVHEQFGALDPSFTPANGGSGPSSASTSNGSAVASFKPQASFQIRACNVVDPVDDCNNLARSVSLEAFPSMKRAFAMGRDRLVSLLASAATVDASSVDDFFASCWKEYGRGDGWRPDLLVHPRQTWHARPPSVSAKPKEQEDKWLSLVPDFLLAPPVVYMNGHGHPHVYGFPHAHHQHSHQHPGHYARHHHQYAQHQPHLATASNGGPAQQHYASPGPLPHPHAGHSPGPQYNGGSHRVGGATTKTSPRRAQSLPGTSSTATLAAVAAAAAASGANGSASETMNGNSHELHGRSAERGPSHKATKRSHESPSGVRR